MCSDGAGGYIAAWGDTRGGLYTYIYAQKISSGGIPQWTANGAPICTANSRRTLPDICPDGAGGAIILWKDLRDGTDFYAQRIDTNGVVQWAADGTRINSNPLKYISEVKICSDGSGGAILVWAEDTTQGIIFLNTDYNIYAQKINSAGAVQWGTDRVIVCDAGGNQVNHQILSDGSGGVIICWPDNRNGTTPDVYAQRLNSAGNAQWATNGLAVCTASETQNWIDSCSDGSGGAIITWGDERHGFGNLDIYAQRVTGAGSLASDPPYLHHISINLSPGAVSPSGTLQFTAAAYDQFNNPFPGASFTWSVANGGGTIDGNGLFTAGASRGLFIDTVVAQSGGVQDKAAVSVGLSITAAVKLEGGLRSPAGMNIPLALKLFDTSTALNSGNILIAVPQETFSTAVGQIIITNSNGTSKINTILVGGLPSGAYHIALFSPYCLVNLKQNVTLSQGLTLDMGTLLAGNADEDSQVFGSDITMFLNDYLQMTGGSRWNNGRCDFDRNGQVTSVDFSLLINNYSKSSPQEIP